MHFCDFMADLNFRDILLLKRENEFLFGKSNQFWCNRIETCHLHIGISQKLSQHVRTWILIDNNRFYNEPNGWRVYHWISNKKEFDKKTFSLKYLFLF